MDRVFKLFNKGQGAFRPVQVVPNNLPKTVQVKVGDEVKIFPCSYMWKDVLLPGEFTKQSTQQGLSLNLQKLEAMATTIKEYMANGNPVPIPYKDHNEETNAGFVVDARVKNGRLELLHQFIGERATIAALQNHVSVEIHGEKADSRGNTYKNLIVHSSLTDDPVVTGQLPWQPLAASRGERVDAPLYIFAASGRSVMDWAKIRKMLGVGDDVPEAKLEEMLQERVTNAGKVTALETEKTTLSNKVTTLEGEKTTLTNELNTQKQQVVTLSNAANKVKPSAREMFFAKSALTSARDRAVSSGALNAATADKIITKFIGDKSKLDTISLSNTPKDEDITLCEGMGRAIETFEAVDGNTAGPASSSTEKTGAQNQQSTTTTKPNTKAGETEEETDEEKKKKAKLSVKDAVGGVGKRYSGPVRPGQTATAGK